jgi:thiol-disulfide isomerase/thioredoxin
MSRSVICLVLAALVAAPVLLLGTSFAQTPATTTASAPTTSPAGEALKKIKDMMEMPTGLSAEQMTARTIRTMPKVIEAEEQMEKGFAAAPELADARIISLDAMSRLAHIDDDTAMADKALAMSKKVMDSDAPLELKLYADAYSVMLRAAPVGAPAATQPAKGAAQLVRDFVARYAKTDSAARAMTIGLRMADLITDAALSDELIERLVKEHPEDMTSRLIMRDKGMVPDQGKPFKALLTKLDGSTLKLPDDLLGKVVVVDFWATWVPPCVQEVPHAKQVYAKYKDKGVEFVGISLDDDKDKFAKFVKDREIGWPQTFSGKGRADPTAIQYTVNRLPSVWVIGKDGKVITDAAEANLEDVLDAVLAGKMTSTTSAPVRPPMPELPE